MALMKKFPVYYQLNAFILHDGDTRRQLEGAVDAAQKSVLRGGHGRWIIHTMDLVLDGDRPQLELVVLIPAGNDEAETLFAVVTFFEAAMARELGAPVDREFRTIGDYDPKCEVCGTEKIHWIRTIRNPLFSDDTYFCTTHLREQKDFAKSSPSSFYWHPPA